MKLRWSPKTKVAVVMLGALALPIGALIAAQLVRLYYFQQTKPVHAIVNQQLLQVLKNVEKQIVLENERLGKELASTLETPGPLDQETVSQRLNQAIRDKPFTDLVVFYSPEIGALAFPRPASEEDAQASERRENADLMVSSLSSSYDRTVEMLEAGEAQHYSVGAFDYLVVLTREQNQYNTAHYVLIHDARGKAAGILGFTLDREYQRRTLFPAAYHKAPAYENETSLFDIAIVGIRDRETHEVVWSSEPTDWESRNADYVGKPFDGATYFGSLMVKLKGKSINQIASDFLYENLALVLAMAVVLFGGLLFTWRSVNREIELARLKADFVSNVSHELKTPLALIRLFAETLEMGRVRGPEKMQEYYATIRKESERLTGLINNLLDFSRIEAGGKQYRFEQTDLANLVGQAIETCRYQIDQQGFELEENIDQSVPPVSVDRESYSLCVLNLLDNAMKYSGNSRRLGVRLDRENGSVRLEVRDQGIGINRKDQQRIFEKFYRAGDPLVHNTKGSGLGLSLVMHVAQAHHGTVTVESSPGQGSKFTLKVPIDDASRN
jgi:signal transduction histidine kinase